MAGRFLGWSPKIPVTAVHALHSPLPLSVARTVSMTDVTPVTALHYTAKRNALVMKVPRQLTLSSSKQSSRVGLTSSGEPWKSGPRGQTDSCRPRKSKLPRARGPVRGRTTKNESGPADSQQENGTSVPQQQDVNATNNHVSWEQDSELQNGCSLAETLTAASGDPEQRDPVGCAQTPDPREL